MEFYDLLADGFGRLPEYLEGILEITVWINTTII